jgi:hypothetical protein
MMMVVGPVVVEVVMGEWVVMGVWVVTGVDRRMAEVQLRRVHWTLQRQGRRITVEGVIREGGQVKADEVIAQAVHAVHAVVAVVAVVVATEYVRVVVVVMDGEIRLVGVVVEAVAGDIRDLTLHTACGGDASTRRRSAE